MQVYFFGFSTGDPLTRFKVGGRGSPFCPPHVLIFSSSFEHLFIFHFLILTHHHIIVTYVFKHKY
jgi:hypothetical protein